VTDCEDCQTAEKNPRTSRFTAHCPECSARSLAQSPAFFDSERDGAMTKTYTAALKYVYRDGWREGHEMAKRWAERLK
jgi:hypothetical protein